MGWGSELPESMRKCFSISPVGPHNEYGAPLTSQQHTTKLGPLRLASSPKLKLGYSHRASHLQKMHLQRKSVEAKCRRTTRQYRESCISQDWQIIQNHACCVWRLCTGTEGLQLWRSRHFIHSLSHDRHKAVTSWQTTACTAAPVTIFGHRWFENHCRLSLCTHRPTNCNSSVNESCESLSCESRACRLGELPSKLHQ